MGHRIVSIGDLDLHGINHMSSSRTHFHGFQDSFAEYGNVDFGLQQDEAMEDYFSKYEKLEEKQQAYLECGVTDGMKFDMLSPPLQTCLEEIAQIFDIQKESRDFTEPETEKLVTYVPSSDVPSEMVTGSTLSTEEIIRIAGVKFIKSVSGTTDIDLTCSNASYSCVSNLSEVSKGVELVQFLLASAEKVGNQKFERASRLLSQCDDLCFPTGNPIERIVYYFSEALRQRINRETGKIKSNALNKEQEVDINRALTTVSPTTLAWREKMPFCKILQAVGVQEIIENVANAKRIHIVDFHIRSGAQWVSLMHALVSLDGIAIDLLKLSAVATDSSKELVENTCERLMNFAKSINLPFCFKLIVVADMLDLKDDMFEIVDNETVAIYSEYILWSLIPQPNRLESMMKVVRKLKPCVMVVVEIDGKNNSLSFVNRFIEALFFFSAWFDCFEACMERECPHRMLSESTFGHGIANMVAAEGEERKIRNVTIDVWRAFLARFGMVDTKMSNSSMYQASLVLEKFPCGNSFTFDNNKNSLLVGWKGTPLLSVSVWKSRSSGTAM